jgi:hypothetical protein
MIDSVASSSVRSAVIEKAAQRRYEGRKRPAAGHEQRHRVDDEQKRADSDKHVERSEARRQVPRRHHADQPGNHGKKGCEIDHVLPGDLLVQAGDPARPIAQRQQIDRDRNGDVVDQRRHVAAGDDLEIAPAQELGHQEGRDAHHRRHQLAAER